MKHIKIFKVYSFFLWFTNITSKVPPRFELGLPDSESGVLTITPWDLRRKLLEAVNFVVT